MPQNNENAGVKSQRAIVCCRNCQVPYCDRHDLNYDRVLNGRYFEPQEQARYNANLLSTKAATDNTLRGLGLKKHPSVFIKTDPALNPFRITPQEVCHIMPNGLGTILQDLLINHILKESAYEDYAQSIREMQSPEWSRLQNPVKHFSSCSYNQLGQLSQMNPFALRSTLRDHMLKEWADTRIPVVFRAELKDHKWSSSDLIVHVYVLFAKAMHLAFLPKVSDAQRNQMHDALCTFHHWYFILLELTSCILTECRFCRLVQAVCKAGAAGYTQRPNLHVLLHLAQTSRDYGNLVNVCCSPGEAKHRPLKRHARKTNNQGVDKQLLRRINTLQTVRFTLDGAFEDDPIWKPITESLRWMQQVTPRVFGPIAPISLIAQKGGLDRNGDELPCAIPNINCLRMGLQIKKAELPDYAPTWAAPSTWIRRALNQIYGTNPSTALPPNMGAFRLTYYKRISFVSKSQSNRDHFHVFKTQNMVRFQGGLYGRIISFFVANIYGVADYFCLINPLVFHANDRVMQSSIWRIAGTDKDHDMPVVVPLMYLEHEHPMFVPYAPVEQVTKPPQEQFWQNDWYTRHYRFIYFI